MMVISSNVPNAPLAVEAELSWVLSGDQGISVFHLSKRGKPTSYCSPIKCQAQSEIFYLYYSMFENNITK